MSHRAGFTLIELSLVLVIIGLIAGGVLVGRDLIKAAEIRAQISQIEKFRTAVNTFRTKYNGLPGDLDATAAAAFGMAARSGTPGNGNGDGLIEYCDGSMNSALLGCEELLFWNDLAFANLIEGDFSADTDSFNTTFTLAQAASYLPAAKLGNNGFVGVFSVTGNETVYGPAVCGEGSFCYAIFSGYSGGPISFGNMIYNGAYANVGPGIPPAEAYAIDSKMDDGLPTGGNVQGGSPSVGLICEDCDPPTENSTINTGGNNQFDPVTACLATASDGTKIYNTNSQQYPPYYSYCLMNFAQ